MPSMRFNARLDTSHPGRPHPSEDARVVADSLIGIDSATVKCLFVVNRSCIHKGFQVSPQVTIQGIQIWRAWRPCSGSSSTCPSVMICVNFLGVRMSPLGTSATIGPIVPAPNDYECGAAGGMRVGKGNRSTQMKPAPVPLYPPQIPYDMTRDRTRAATAGSRRLTACAIGLP
jgi:hypothetical protein